MSSKCILLLSGGLDSGALLFWAKNQQFDIVPLFINYGQIAFPGEWFSVQNLLTTAGLPAIFPLSIPEISSLGSHMPIDGNHRHSANQYYPSRNLLLLTLAAICAYQSNISLILIGLVSDTANVFPDCSSEFINHTDALLKLEYPNLQIDAPFITRSKIDIVKETIPFGFNPETTFCCNRFPDHHCWSCPSCLDRYKILNSVKNF
jgi:7-cyano-7-deazaguanine synthase